MRPALLVLLCFCWLPAACRSDDAAMTSAAEAGVPCTCGTPEAAIEGCAHPACLRGVRNPDNPDCVCGTLDIGR